MSDSDKFSYDVAVIGMSCRFPGAKNVEEFWQNLLDGVESVSFFSDEELLGAGVEPALLGEANYVKAGAVIEDIEYFDAAFFGLTPREAEMMDPQHRLFLEHAWAALETAGYAADKHAGRVGVFAGESFNAYLLNNLVPRRELIEAVGTLQTLIGNDRDHLTTQTAYRMNLKGPCVSVQTACSTSLVAVHMACQSLLNRECDMALAGGVSVAVPQVQGAVYQEGSIISQDGHCRAFDAGAAGTVKGSGVGIVVLKRLADALADGDPIDAIIKGSAINNDGALKVGYTAPSVEGQAGVIEEALAVAAVEPETIGYVEAHGTGTTLGDPIEIAALTQAFGASTEKKNFCAVGSVKTNIGHLDAAAGVAGLIKTVLALKHKMIPPSLHFERPNPNIDFAATPFYVCAKLTAWESGGEARRAGVSSFGIGGTNAHVVLEEAADAAESPDASRTHQLLTLSAKTESALEQLTADLAVYLKEHRDASLPDIAYTLQVGRKSFPHRRALVCHDADDALRALEPVDRQLVHTRFVEADAGEVVFMFPGQGSQHVNMARELYESEPTFRREVERLADLLREHAGLDLPALLYPPAGETERAAERLAQTSVTQPALFVIEYALARVYEAWGVRPQAMIGHSLGEFVAACLAGVFTPEDALKLVAVRGRLMQGMPVGAMIAVPLSEQEVQPFISAPLSLAAVNAPGMCVISGVAEAVARAEQQLAARGIESRRLHTSHAYHSATMEEASRLFAEEVRKIKPRAPEIPFISGLTGTWITAEQATDPSYWSKQLREPVRFAAGVAELLKDSRRILLEVGPGRVLSGFAGQQRNGSKNRPVFASLPHPQERKSAVASLLEALGQLWTAGVEIDSAALYARERRRRMRLPTYPFERQRFWIDAAPQSSARPDVLHRKPDAADWFYVPSWRRSVVRREAVEQETETGNPCRLIFADECGLGSLIARRMEETGGSEVFVVKAGEGFGKVAERTFEVNPQRREDYDALLDELQALGHSPEAILHLWNVTRETEAELTPDAFAAAQSEGFDGLLSLVQSLGERMLAEPLRLFVVTNNLQEVTGDESLSPEKATLTGLCKVVPQEYPQFNCRSIDVVLPSGAAGSEALADNILAELTAREPGVAVAYRGRHRWVQAFEPIRFVGSIGERQTGAKRLRDGGVYLLTGGGDIDIALAGYLAANVRCKLVLNGYADFPAREEWPAWLAAHDEQDDVSRRITKLSELEATGAEVMLCGVDVADREKLAAVVAEVRERFGNVNGVFHTAAVTGGGMIQLKTPEAFAEVFRPKARGTLALHEALRDAPPDFVVLFSTSLSLTGVFGQVDYCAANAFLDAFARAETARGETFTVAINWNLPQWENWQDSAATGVSEFQAQFAEQLRAYGISPEEGAEAVGRILSDSQPQVVVSTQDFQALIETQQTAAASNLFEQLKPGRGFDGLDRGEGGTGYVAPEGELEQRVAGLWQELFGIGGVGRHDNFFELGGNSLLAIQLVSRMRKVLEVELPLSRLFESPTVAELAVVITESQQKSKETEEIERLLSEIEGLSLDELQTHLSEELQTGSESS